MVVTAKSCNEKMNKKIKQHQLYFFGKTEHLHHHHHQQQQQQQKQQQSQQ